MSYLSVTPNTKWLGPSGRTERRLLTIKRPRLAFAPHFNAQSRPVEYLVLRTTSPAAAVVVPARALLWKFLRARRRHPS